MIPVEKVNKYYEEYIEEISSKLDSVEVKEPGLLIGEKIKKIRESKGLSIDEVAKRTGFSKEFLIDIENGKVSPPLGIIVKLSKALDTMVANLFGEPGEKNYCVMKVKDQKVVPRTSSTGYNYKYIPLATGLKEMHMEAFIVKLLPESKEEKSVHDGEEFIYVLDGEVKVVIGDDVEILNMGDTIYYLSSIPHYITTNTDKPALILAVIYGAH